MAINITCKVHPVVLFQIADAHERRNLENHRVIGTLVGKSVKRRLFTWRVKSDILWKQPVCRKFVQIQRNFGYIYYEVLVFFRFDRQPVCGSEKLLLRSSQGIRRTSGNRFAVCVGHVRTQQESCPTGMSKHLIENLRFHKEKKYLFRLHENVRNYFLWCSEFRW